MDRVGRYRLDQRIGIGAFAAVWRGHDADFDLPVAVKILAEHWMHDLDVRRRFTAEARLLRQIAHERIVRVHDIGTVGGPDGQPYFVMDYADAGTMAELVKQPAEPDESLRLCVQAARGIQALHDHGHLHRDIKPANLLLDTGRRGRNVLIGDLGLAKALSELSGITVTAGSPAYMAPEQAGSAGGFDLRADVYALGAVTYAVLAGRPPFQGASGLSEVAMRDPGLRPAPLADLLSLEPSLDDLLRRTLAHDPDERPDTAQAFADELEAIAGGRTIRIEPVRQEAHSQPERPSRPDPGPPTRRPLDDSDDPYRDLDLFRPEQDEPTLTRAMPRSEAVATDEPLRTRRAAPQPARETAPGSAAAPARETSRSDYRSVADYRASRGESSLGSVLLVLLVFVLATAVTWLAWRAFGQGILG